MHSSPARPPQRSHSTARPLLVVTALVLLIHGLLLGAVPSAVHRLRSATDARAQQEPVARFVTRTIPPDVAREVAPAPLPAPGTLARPGPRTLPATAPAEPRMTAAAAHPADPSTAPALDAGAAPATTATPTSPTALAAPASPETLAQAAAPAPSPRMPPVPPAAAGSKTAGSGPIAFAQPVRLLYDGLGEERGFIKYAASGELLWLHDGAQYSARLEISAWGFRVRTWTSKGTLSDVGLAPQRFGDKPRGAELATHFQRDKGLISFSANNPDVPLQAGAQDKLSAILQLSALVAGAPAQYNAGSTIRFQAADAHRAELWDFKVGALEALELPGGPKQALKLSKAPTVEFDQGIEVWLAPDLHYLPVRLRITEANGAFADLLWRKTQNSE
jgi:Protein of unknown function (DUF3108)